MSLIGASQKKEAFTDKLKKTTALLYYDDQFVSSGIIFKIKNAIYCITAGHSIYGKKYNEIKKLAKLKVKIKEIDLSVEKVVGDANFAKENDIVILKIERNDTYQNIPSFEFYSVPENPSHSLVFRGSYNPTKGINNFRHNYFDETVNNSSKYKIEIRKENLVNSVYSHGSDWLGGLSGSGIFYENHDKVCCCGIIVEIINKGDEGKILCASFEPLVDLFPDLNLIQSEKLDYDSNLSEISFNKIIEANTVEVVSDWEKEPANDSKDNPRVTHINNKLPLIYPESELEKEKARLIKNFCIGLEFIELELTKNETLKALYIDAYNVFDMQERTIYADSGKEARDALKKIKDKYELYLYNMLEDKGFNQAIIILLKEYAISEWISNCSINILNDE